MNASRNAIANSAFRSLCLLGFCAAVAAPLHADEKTEKKITFDDHIKPIFREHCTTCHSESDKESDLALDSYSATLIGGSGGEVVVESDASGSRLIALVEHSEGPFMPPDSDPIPKEQIDLLKLWVNQGMPENSGSKIKRKNTAAAAMLSTSSLGKPEGPPPMPKSLLKEVVTTTDRPAAISAMAASPWAPLVAVGGQEQVVIYHADTSEMLGVIPFPEGEPQSLTFTRDGRQLLIGGGRHSHSGCAVLVDIESGDRITKVGDELDIVLAADISPDKSRIALAGPQKIVRVFDSLSGEIVHELKKHTDWVFSLRYSPDGVLLASGDRSNGLVVWEADTGLIYSELKGHRGAVRSLDFRADSNVLASASLDGTLKTWDMFESKQLKSWNAHGGGATAVCYAINGQLASCGRDRKVKLWDGDGKMLKEFPGLGDSGLEVALTGDAKRIAGGDWNGGIMLWDTEDPKRRIQLVSNPLSLETRIARATEKFELASKTFVEAESIAAQQSKLLATQTKQREDLAAKLDESKKSLSASEQLSAQLTTESSKLAAEIEQLQKQLAALTAQRKEKDAQLATVAAEIPQHKQTVASTEQALKKADENLKLTQEAQAKAAQALAAAKEQRDVANDRLQKAQQAKNELEATTKRLQESATVATQQVAELESAISDASKLTESLKQADEATTQQLNQIAEQIKQLTAQLEKAKQDREAAAAKLQQSTTQLEELTGKLEEAQGEAAEAEEKLKLHEAAYGQRQ